MSGHSKWSTIKRKKGANDAKRGKIFTKLGRDIMIAARQGGDPESNFALRLAVEKARGANMPKDNIERAIKRGSGDDKDGGEFLEITYEAYGPSGVALLIDVLTDNRNRTIADIKHILNKYNGSMAEVGSVSWQFEQKGYISVEPGQKGFDEIFMIAAESGADDVIDDPEILEIYTPREALQSVSEALRESGVNLDEARLDWVAKTPMDVDAADAVKVLNVVEALEDLDDIQMVYSNLNLTDEAVSSFESSAG